MDLQEMLKKMEKYQKIMKMQNEALLQLKQDYNELLEEYKKLKEEKMA